MLDNIHWLGHASFRIDADRVIYIDPWKLKNPVPADLILVTHAHHDHLSTEDIAAIAGDDTVIVCSPACAQQVTGDVRPVSPGDSLMVGDVRIEAVPSYNTNKPNHPRDAGNVGYIVEVAGQRIYHAGDTDLIPEMADIRCDVALLPVGGKYTMDAKEGAEALSRIQTKVAVPMHWGSIIGSERAAETFQRLSPPEVEVVIMEAE
jgi:L-ascorbate metabolism protein UlaG (beta-lactamase superfamily)